LRIERIGRNYAGPGERVSTERVVVAFRH
jgi:hypothetical protein